MSRFTDFDDFLRQEESTKNRMQEEKREKIRQSRNQLDPWIQELFASFKEYYEKILLPRHQYVMILKKDESIDGFHYRVNLIPKGIVSEAFDPTISSLRDHLRLQSITDNDWHYDVGLQFDLLLSVSTEQELEPKIVLRAWGDLPEGKKKLLPKNVAIAYKMSWRREYMEVTITGERKRMLDLFEEMLIAMTPQVLAHLKEIWGL